MANIYDYELRECPFCGGTDLSFDYASHQGHGDRTYSNLRVICCSEGCEATVGIGNWGNPDDQAYLKAVAVWNKRRYIIPL